MLARLFQIGSLCITAAILFTLGFFSEQLSLRDIAYFVLLTAAGLLFFVPIPVAIQILTLYLGIEGFAKIMTRYNPVVHIGADLLIVFLWLRIGLGFIINRDRSREALPPLTSIIILHFFWFFATTLNPYSLSLISSLAGVKLYITIVSLYFFGYYLGTDIPKIRKFMAVWVFVCALEVITSLYQASIGPKSVTSLSPGYAVALMKYKGYAFRPFGLTNQPGLPGIFVYLTIPFILYFFFHSTSYLMALVMLVLIPAATLTLLVCQIRSAILKALVGGVFFLALTLKDLKYYSMRTRVIALPFIVFLGASFFSLTPYLISNISDASKQNKVAIERSLSLFEYNKIAGVRSGALDRFIQYAKIIPFGAGMSRIGASAGKFEDLNRETLFFKNAFFADNLWIEILIDLGIPGLIIYSIIIIGIFFIGINGFRITRNPDVRAIQAVIICTLISIILGTVGAEPILYNPEGPFFWFFSGVLVRISTVQAVPKKLSLVESDLAETS